LANHWQARRLRKEGQQADDALRNMLTAKQELIMADEKLVNILAWCKREREYFQMQREMLRSGTFRISRLEGDTPVDESQKSIETLSNNTAELDVILADCA
jgi:hypothetical protein